MVSSKLLLVRASRAVVVSMCVLVAKAIARNRNSSTDSEKEFFCGLRHRRLCGGAVWMKQGPLSVMFWHGNSFLIPEGGDRQRLVDRAYMCSPPT